MFMPDDLEESDEETDEESEGDDESVTDADLEEERAKLPELKKPGETEQSGGAAKPELPPLRVFEAALFLANRPASYADLSKITGFPRELCKTMAHELKAEYAERGGATEVVVGEEVAAMQVRSVYLDRVSGASKEINLTKKGTRILALIAKKKEILQKDLKHYFRGEIYAYVTELRQAGYLDSERRGQTRLLRPTQKFYDTFQMVLKSDSGEA
jgi:chromosome segregation and condensation protein ScpB